MWGLKYYYMFGKQNELLKLNTVNVMNALAAKGYNELDLCFTYIDNFKNVGIPVNSPLRSGDKNASLSTTWSSTGKIIISDFGYKKGMNIVGYIQELYNVKYMEALGIIVRDFNLDTVEMYNGFTANTIKARKKHHMPIKYRQEVVIRKKSRGWIKEDREYWGQFGIDITQLMSKGIQAISAFQIINPNKGSNNIINIPKGELGYSYPELLDGVEIFKIYLPYGLRGDKGFKWFSNVPLNVIFNLRFTPDRGNLLIIQSSYKDCMVMENFGYNSIPLNGEGMWFTDKLWNDLKTKWDKIIYFGDNDSDKESNPGKLLCNQWSKLYNIDYIHTPDNTASDISDYYYKYGREKTKELLTKLID